MIESNQNDGDNSPFRMDRLLFNRIKGVSYYASALRLKVEELLNLNNYINKNLKFEISKKKEINLMNELEQLKDAIVPKEEMLNAVIKLIIDKINC